MPTFVAFLDVLGFSSYTEEDLAAAIGVLRHQQFILGEKLTNQLAYPPGIQDDARLRQVAEAHLVNSFLHFLPCSDSTFVVSEDAGKFLRQLSNLLIACLELVGEAYNEPENDARPEAVQVLDPATGRTIEENWFPPLWSGGLAIGTFRSFRLIGIENGTQYPVRNLAGTAVVKAVKVSSTARGPRLFCEAGFHRHFTDDILPFFRTVTPAVTEVLWPAFKYLDGTNPRVEMNSFGDMWCPAVSLWRSKRGHRAFEHYDEYLRLLIRSLIAWGETVGMGGDAREFAQDRVRADLGENFIAAYLD